MSWDSRLGSSATGNTEAEEAMKEKVEQAIGKIRPALQADGGDIELVDVSEEGDVQVRLKGACSGCPMAQVTMTQGVERIIKQEVPDVKSVKAV